MRSLLALALVAACGGGGGGSTAEKPKLDPVNEKKAEKDAKGLVTEITDTIGRAKAEGLMALLTEQLVVFGPRRTDQMQTRSDALVALQATFDAMGKDEKPKVETSTLNVVASPTGLSAWVVDIASIEGKEMASTMVLSNEDDFWVVVAASVAHTPPMREVRALLKKDGIVPPGMPGIERVTDSAEDAVERFKSGLANPAVWGDEFGKRTDAIVIGPGAGDVTRGKKDVAKLWKKREKVNHRYAVAGEWTAATTTDGQIAWVTVPVVQFADDDEPLPLRLFGIFEKVEGQWRIVALQESLALDEPGVGANFKKITPPAVKAEEPPPKPKAEEKPKKKKKKKKGD